MGSCIGSGSAGASVRTALFMAMVGLAYIARYCWIVNLLSRAISGAVRCKNERALFAKVGLDV